MPTSKTRFQFLAAHYRSIMKTTVAILIWLLLIPSVPALADVESLDDEELLKRVDRALQPESFEMYRKLINIEPDGRRREYTLYTVRKGRDRMLALFLEPPSERGRSTLRLGDNMWLYIPDVGRPIRTTSLQSVVGGIFSNADIMQLDYHVEYKVEDREDGDDHIELQLRARTREVAYDRLVMRVDPETLTPTVIEAYTATDMLIKTLRFHDIKDFGDGIVRPSRMETTSPLHEGYRAIMLFAEIRPRELQEEVFTQDFMPRANELRE